MSYNRTVIKIELLNEGPLTEIIDLEQIVYEMTRGDTSGRLTVESSVVVSGPEMAKLLKAQDSDPAFLGLDDEGNKL